MHDTGQSSAGWHRIAQFARCPRAFAYHHLLGLVPIIEPPHTGIGTVLHTCLKAYYRGEDVDCALEALPNRYAPYRITGEKLYLGHQERWEGREGFTRVLAVEEEVAVFMGKKRPFTRRLDLVVEQLDRGVPSIFIYDHKTAGRPDVRLQTARHDWSLATQEVIGRVVLPKRYGLPWGGLVLNLVGSGSERVYVRDRIRWPEEVLAAIPGSIAHRYDELDALLERDLDPWEWPMTGACHDGFKCDYIPLCYQGRGWLHQYETE